MERNKSFQNKPILYLVSTPIGNLGEVSKRAIEVLNSVDFVAAEDTRNSLNLLNNLGVKKKMISLHEHNEREASANVIKLILEGSSIAYMSDAGYPGISDPGALLVQEAIKNNVPVSVINGSSAFLTALIPSGLPTDHFYFHGFLPSKDSDAKKDAVAEKLIEELSTFLVSLKQEKKYSLERRIKTTLNTLMHKEDFIGRVEVVIDGEDMDINLYSVDGKVINKDSLSKGEQQLYATSILKALVDESGIQFPVFIDSPLQKFDKSHATKIITEFYPQISKQVVLFPLLYKELTAEEYNVMKPLVKTTYLIKNDVTHSFFEEVPINNFIKES